ncbi:DUF4931 domain-containing protein, partial [Klebsiella pneumoniae]|uniref:DUF4931 domain-containing protein n=1 Tax=Klebsiella pneumoniae TaxID=573 RepID=UPI003A8B9A97
MFACFIIHRTIVPYFVSQEVYYLLSKWQLMEESGHYRSVVLYRNFGPLSGGSLRHPHSQIV